MDNLVYLAPGAAIIGLIFAWLKARKVESAPAGDAVMQDIAGQIEIGALAFLRTEYRVLSVSYTHLTLPTT